MSSGAARSSAHVVVEPMAEREISLVDDLADVLAHVVVGWEPLLGHDLAQHPSVVRVMARYQESKVPCEAFVRHGPGRQSTTKCQIKGPHTYHYADDPMCPGWEWQTKVASVDDFGDIREVPDDE